MAGWGAYAATHQGQLLDLDAVPVAVVGALVGYLAQREVVKEFSNPQSISKLCNEFSHLKPDTVIPQTSMDWKGLKSVADVKKWNPYIASCAAYATVLASVISANNAGLINSNSPEELKVFADSVVGSAAYIGGMLSWLAYDKLDDVFYHQLFLNTGMGAVLLPFGAGLTANHAAGFIPGVKPAKDKIKRAASVATKLAKENSFIKETIPQLKKTFSKTAKLALVTASLSCSTANDNFKKEEPKVDLPAGPCNSWYKFTPTPRKPLAAMGLN